MVFPRKLKQLPLFGMLFTYVFLTSTLIVSTLCLLLMIILWPISKNLYRRISSLLAYTVFSRKLVAIGVLCGASNNLQSYLIS